MVPNRRKWAYFKKLGYTPRAGQRAAHEAADTHAFIGIFSYPRGGKSIFAAREVGATWWRSGSDVHPGYHCWIVAPTYDLGSKEFGYVWEDHGRLGLLKRAQRSHFDIRGGDMEIVYPWGWWIRVRTVENPLTLLAEELDELILSEASQLPETAWDRYLSARTKVRHGRVFVPTTPKGKNWLYDRFYLPAQPEVEGRPNPGYDDAYWGKTVSHLKEVGDIYQPGIYPPEHIERAKREMPPDVFLEQFGGQFVSYAGLVFQGLQFHRHGVPPFPIPAQWDVLVAIDPGTSPDPCAILFGAWDHQTPRHLWLWAEIYEKDKPAIWYAHFIRQLLGGRRPLAVIVDPSEKQFRVDLSANGISSTIPHSRQFQDGWQAVMALARTERLHVFNHLKTFWGEVERFEWKEGPTGEVRSGKKTTVQASDTRGPDHLMSALRYMALYPVGQIPAAPPDPTLDIRAGLDPASHRAWESWKTTQRRLMVPEGGPPLPETDAPALVDEEMEAIFQEDW